MGKLLYSLLAILLLSTTGILFLSATSAAIYFIGVVAVAGICLRLVQVKKELNNN